MLNKMSINTRVYLSYFNRFNFLGILKIHFLFIT